MCGIVGVFNAPGAAELTAAGLHHIQPRARDYAGMVTTDGTNMFRETGPGAVRHVFTEKILNLLHGRHAIGHIRYPTVHDDPKRDNTQPILSDGVALAHNGNLTNAEMLRQELEAAGSRLATSMDSECILRLFQHARGSIPERLIHALGRVRGSYSLVMLFRDQLAAIRDPSGNRPLTLGRKGDSWFVASESVALDGVEAQFERNINPGEILIISEKGPESFQLAKSPQTDLAPCVFEEIYYSHPASKGFDLPIIEFRLELGRKLAEVFKRRFNPVPEIDIITPVPDSSTHIGVGFARTMNPAAFLPVIVRSRDVGRTFIAADRILRNWLVRQKYSIIPSPIRGKTIAVVDDSIVRLTTLPPLIRMIKNAGAQAVHVLIACPPIYHPCEYGINTPTYGELAAATISIEGIKNEMGADSLTYLSLKDLQEISGKKRCFACMTGEYPLPR